MDLSFPPFTQDHELHAWPAELAVLLLGLNARQGGSVTAEAQAGLTTDEPAVPPMSGLLAPDCGSFNGLVAADISRWRET